MSRHELWYTDDAGNLLEVLDTTQGFSYALNYGDVGAISCALPYDRQAIYHTGWQPDHQLYVWRAADNSPLELMAGFFLRQRKYATDAPGRTTLTLSGFDPNELLRRRIVAEYAGSAQAEMTNEADDMMKAAVRRALVDGQDYNGADTFRDIDDLGFSVEADSTRGPSITKAFSWQNLLTVVQGIQATAKAAGTEVFFRLYATGIGAFTFRTYTGQPGADRTLSGTSPLFFGLEYGNLANPTYLEDYSAEENFIYAGGQGEGSARLIREASDNDRINASRWNRREGFAPATNATTPDGVAGMANDRLAKYRPQFIFAADLLSTPDTPYGGSGWRVGDKVTCEYVEKTFDVIIRSVTITVDGSGRETIRARAENIS